MMANFVPLSFFTIGLLASVSFIYGQLDYDIIAGDKECKWKFKKIDLNELNVMEEQLLGGKIKAPGMKEACNCQIKVKFNAQKDGVHYMECQTFLNGEYYETEWTYDPKSKTMNGIGKDETLHKLIVTDPDPIRVVDF